MVCDPYDSIDGLSPSELADYEQQQWTRLLERARQAPYYRDSIPAGEVELSELPLLDKESLLAATPPRSLDLLTGPLEKAVVFKTGGTTGVPKFSPYSHDDFRRLGESTARALWASGLRPTDRVANCFAVGELYASFLCIHRALEEVGVTSFPFTFHAPHDQVVMGLEHFQINTVMGLATQMVHLCDKVHREKPQLTIEKVFYAAEHLHPEERHHLLTQNRPEVIATAGYGAVDGGMIGHQCPHSIGGVHHILPGTVMVEILDQDSLEPTEGVGELVVTNLERHLMPVIRYRVGDLARWVPGDCPCGRATPRFELLGRGDDQLRIGYDTVTHDDIRRALTELAELSSSMQLVKQRSDGKDRLVVRVEARGGSGSRELVARARQQILDRKPLLVEHIEQNYTHDLVVEILPPNSLPRRPHSGKLPPVLDESVDC